MSNRELKVTCYITKKSCTDGGKPTKKFNFEWPVTFFNKCDNSIENRKVFILWTTLFNHFFTNDLVLAMIPTLWAPY